MSKLSTSIDNKPTKWAMPNAQGKYQFWGLLLLIFYLKAAIYLSIFPPFEGWDEYQHLAYIYYLQDNDTLPVLKESFVSDRLLRQVVSTPQSPIMLEKSPDLGALGYNDYFNNNSVGPTYNPDHEKVPLYQAQHGSIYYIVMHQILDYLGLRDNALYELFTLRLINILLAGLSLLIILRAIDKLIKNKVHKRICSFLVVCQPLFLLNSIRSTNDILAILLATIVIYLGLFNEKRKSLAWNVLAGILIGLATWGKSIALILFPFWLMVLIVSLTRKDINFRKFLLLSVVSMISSVPIILNYIMFNLHHYEMMFVMQEALVNKDNGITFNTLLGAFLNFSIFYKLLMMWFKKTTWIGGWSMLHVSNISNITFSIFLISLISWLSALYPRLRKHDFGVMSIYNSTLCFLLVILTSMALGWHVVQSQAAWGISTTCPWYTAIALPWFLLVFYDGATCRSVKLGFTLSLILLFIYLYADIMGLYTMLSFYSGNTQFMTMLASLFSLQPVVIGKSGFIMLVLLFSLSWMICIFIVTRDMRTYLKNCKLMN